MYKIIEEYVNSGNEIRTELEADRWKERVRTFLLRSKGENVRREFDDLCYTRDVFDNISRQIGYLEAMLINKNEIEYNNDSQANKDLKLNKRIFIVHGHDNEAKESLCRFIEQLGLEPIVLHEQANEGLTIVEKFEKHSNVSFAIVLLTPDDKGSSVNDLESPKFRARQNVVFELGYFLGSLGRERVCALHKGDIEIPSDYQGVLYIKLDEPGAWKNKIAQELVRSHMEIELSALLK